MGGQNREKQTGERVRVNSFIDAQAVHEVVRFLADRCDGATPNNRLRQSRFVGL